MLSLLLFRSLSSEMSIRIFGLPTGGQNPLCASNKKGPKGPFLFTEISLEMLSVYLAAVFFDLPASDTVRSFFTFSRVDLPNPGTLSRSSTDLHGVFLRYSMIVSAFSGPFPLLFFSFAPVVVFHSFARLD